MMHRSIMVPVLGLVLLALAALSLASGMRSIPLEDVWSALTGFDDRQAGHIVVREMRVPRTLAALLAGAALGLSGALMQALTRNPLADPGILGINGGAAVGVVVSVWVLGMTDPATFVWAALIGAGLAAVMVYALGFSGGRSHPVRLVLAGAALTALFFAVVRGLLILSQEALEVYRLWVLGGVDTVDFETITALTPFLALGAGLAVIAGSMLNALLLGEDTARALGVRIWLVQALTVLAVVLLCGTTVAMAGPIAFVGLIVPHLARRLAGTEMRWMLIFSALIGAGLLLSADLLGRTRWLFGIEMQAGVMIALIGGPAMIWIARVQKAVRL